MLLYLTVRSCKYVARFVSAFAGCTSHRSYAPNGAQVRSALGVKIDLKQKRRRELFLNTLAFYSLKPYNPIICTNGFFAYNMAQSATAVSIARSPVGIPSSGRAEWNPQWSGPYGQPH